MRVRICQVNPRSADTKAVLLDLQSRCLPEDEPYAPDKGYWWVAYFGSIPIGFAGLVRSVRWFDTGYLCRAGVISECRGHGVQKKLIRVRIQKAKKLGWRWLITDTTDNPASSNSLISCGFKLFEPSRPWSFRRSLYWVRRV